MQPRRGHPPAPASLPAIPRLSKNVVSNSNTISTPSQAAQAVTAALSNPYTQTFSSGYHGSHYAQAYAQYGEGGSSWPAVNTYGYTLSSTYVQGSSTLASNQLSRGEHQLDNGHDRPPQLHNPSSQGSWYQFGNSKCSYKNCTFTGSQKALETHRMDRHLIYPPGWDHKKKKSDWDADPSLKGLVFTRVAT